MESIQPSAPVNSLPVPEERTWAALAHASILLFGIGSIAALLIWITRRKKSAYVAYHALQALLYQTLQTVVYLLFGLLLAILSFSLTVLINTLFLAYLDANSFWLFFAVQIIPSLIFLILSGGYLLGAAIMAVLCLTGRNPRYPWIGPWLSGYLDCAPKQVDERQERMTAAACHLGAYINLWGMALPLIAWLSEKKHSAVLRFQGLQALVYQAIGFAATILYFLGMFALLIILMITVTIGISLPAASQPNNGLILFLILIPAMLMVLLTGLWLLVQPFYQTFPLVAAWQVSHGKDYRYPVLGKLIANNSLAKVKKLSQG